MPRWDGSWCGTGAGTRRGSESCRGGTDPGAAPEPGPGEGQSHAEVGRILVRHRSRDPARVRVMPRWDGSWCGTGAGTRRGSASRPFQGFCGKAPWGMMGAATSATGPHAPHGPPPSRPAARPPGWLCPAAGAQPPAPAGAARGSLAAGKAYLKEEQGGLEVRAAFEDAGPGALLFDVVVANHGTAPVLVAPEQSRSCWGACLRAPWRRRRMRRWIRK
jgi:hypothetical protein